MQPIPNASRDEVRPQDVSWRCNGRCIKQLPDCSTGRNVGARTRFNPFHRARACAPGSFPPSRLRVHKGAPPPSKLRVRKWRVERAGSLPSTSCTKMRREFLLSFPCKKLEVERCPFLLPNKRCVESSPLLLPTRSEEY